MGRIRYCQQYPDLFAGLPADQVWSVEQTLANGRLEGWGPGPPGCRGSDRACVGPADADRVRGPGSGVGQLPGLVPAV
jgi:diadenosine tetraphosphatase ApaH/serine/threonine PP2A family protein phosphatase